MEVPELLYEHKVLLFAQGTLDGLVRKGLLNGPIRLTDSGRALLALLEAEGFQPDKAESDRALRFLLARGA